LNIETTEEEDEQEYAIDIGKNLPKNKPNN